MSPASRKRGQRVFLNNPGHPGQANGQQQNDSTPQGLALSQATGLEPGTNLGQAWDSPPTLDAARAARIAEVLREHPAWASIGTGPGDAFEGDLDDFPYESHAIETPMINQQPAVEDDPPSGPTYHDVRAEVATWPIPDRERWGRLANDLADAGAVWPADEIEAFRQITGTLDCPAAKPQRPERVTAAELRAIDSSLSWAEAREILA